MSSFGGPSVFPAGWGVLPGGAITPGVAFGNSAAIASKTMAHGITPSTPSTAAPMGPGSYQAASGGSQEFVWVPQTAPGAFMPGNLPSSLGSPGYFPVPNPTGDSTLGRVNPTGDSTLGGVNPTGDFSSPFVMPTGDFTPGKIYPTGDVTLGMPGTGDYLDGMPGTGDYSSGVPGVIDTRGPRGITDGSSGFTTTGDAHGGWSIPAGDSSDDWRRNGCIPRPFQGNGQVIIDESRRAPPGCVRYPSWGSYPVLSPWLAIPDGVVPNYGWPMTAKVLGAGAAEVTSSLGSTITKIALAGGAAFVGYQIIKKTTRGSKKRK